MNKATDFGLVAYASSKACSKVLSAVTVLPTLLDVEILSRFAIWPKSFDMFPPNSDNIGLYFFPLYERYASIDYILHFWLISGNVMFYIAFCFWYSLSWIRDELSFDRVLNDIIEQEFALKAVINNVELLIFSSHLLPPNDRSMLETLCFCYKYRKFVMLGILFIHLFTFPGICEKYYLWGAFKPKPMSGNIQSS